MKATSTLNLVDLFQRHRRELHIFLTRKLRDRETAADLTQETFVRMAEQLQRRPERPITHSRSYLYRTASNLAVDHVRRQQRNPNDVCDTNDLPEIPDDLQVPERMIGGRQQLDRVAEAMTRLPPMTREVFHLTRVQGLKYREAARQLGVSESTVQKHLTAALGTVMHHLGEER